MNVTHGERGPILSAARNELVAPVTPSFLETPEDSIPDQRTVRVLHVHSPDGPARSVDPILSAHGGQVLQFVFERASGAAAAAARLADPGSVFGLILWEIWTDGRTEAALLGQIRAAAPGTPVIVLCGPAEEADAVRWLEAGAADYLFQEEAAERTLSRVLRGALDRRRLAAELDRQKRNLAASESISRKMVNQLRDEIGKRKHVEKMKDDFINTASHELRAPLAVMTGAIDNLRDGVVGALTEAQAGYVDMLTKYADRLARITNNLLDVSKLESGRARMDRQSVDLAGLAAQARQDFEMTAKNRGITLQNDVPGNIPAVYADLDMATQVMTNLVSNALKFARRKVTIQAREADQQEVGGVLQHTLLQELTGIQITVADDGPGIDAEHIKDLFNKFVQVHRPDTANGHKGTGLGLAICKEIVEMHQGKIWVESKPGKGTKFHFVLPKFGEGVVIHAFVRKNLADAVRTRSPMSVLALSLLNAGEVREASPPGEFKRLCDQIRCSISARVLRDGDGIEYDPEKSAFVILVQSGQDGAASVQRRVRAKLEDLFRDREPKIQFGLGAAIYPEAGADRNTLLARAFDHTEIF
ncbi:hypothetical protein HY522_06765 [bacterium]|nr:hypothetical protein [bacterium]